jgi:hypothetical protein
MSDSCTARELHLAKPGCSGVLPGFGQFSFVKVCYQDLVNWALWGSAIRIRSFEHCEVVHGTNHPSRYSLQRVVQNLLFDSWLALRVVETGIQALVLFFLKMPGCRHERWLCCCCSVRCLAEKMGDHDFGEACREEIMDKLQRRWSTVLSTSPQLQYYMLLTSSNLGIKCAEFPCLTRLNVWESRSEYGGYGHPVLNACVMHTFPGKPTGSWTLHFARLASHQCRSCVVRRTRLTLRR